LLYEPEYIKEGGKERVFSTARQKSLLILLLEFQFYKTGEKKAACSFFRIFFMENLQWLWFYETLELEKNKKIVRQIKT